MGSVKYQELTASQICCIFSAHGGRKEKEDNQQIKNPSEGNSRDGRSDIFPVPEGSRDQPRSSLKIP